MLIPLLQIGGVHSKYLQGGCQSATNGTNKATLTASRVKPTYPPHSVSILMYWSADISNDVYTTSIQQNHYVYHRLFDRAKGKIFNKL